MNLERREFLRGAGALIVSFSVPELAFAQAQDPKLQQLDAWLAVGADGQVTVFCGKVELGTGVQTALAQIVAEELDVAFARVFMLMGDTALCVILAASSALTPACTSTTRCRSLTVNRML